MFDKYTKIVYQSEPIGEYGIVLYLTKFDLEAYNRDQELEKNQNIEIVNPLNSKMMGIKSHSKYELDLQLWQSQCEMLKREIELEHRIYQARCEVIPIIKPLDCNVYNYCKNGDYLELHK